MTAFYLLSDLPRAVLLLWLLCLLLLNLCLLAAIMERLRWYQHGLAALLPLLLCGLALVMLTTWLKESLQGGQPHPATWFFAALPAGVYLAFLLPGSAGALYLLRRETQYRKGTITQASVKESVDNLPAGLCFATDAGLILLANKVMEELCHRITDRDLQDAESFWQTLTRDALVGEIRRVLSGERPILRFADGQAWTFARRAVVVEGKTVIQITAVDTTDLDDLNLRLQQDNAALAEMGRQLRRYIHDVTEVKAREERLATKMRIHDEVGFALLATRRLLDCHRAGRPTDTGELLDLWRRNIAVLRGAAETKKPTALDSLTAAAAAIGVRLRLEGNLPADAGACDLILYVAGECLNNAARHARATALYLEISNTGQGCTVVFSNDGRAPSGPVAEGGGLSDLRRRIDQAGGIMQVSHTPRFSLCMTLPIERGE
jgi:signal transduction histidine kinase